MGEFNIAPNTQIGKIEIDHTIYEGENAYSIEADKYSRGGEFIENMVTDNFIEFCERWFHMAGVEEVIHDIDEYFARYRLGRFSNLINSGFSAILPVTKVVQPAIEFGSHKPTNPIVINTSRNRELNYDNLSSRKENNDDDN